MRSDRSPHGWTTMFRDDIAICGESRQQVEANLERWRYALGRRGMKISTSKTEYMCVNEKGDSPWHSALARSRGSLVDEFRYLGSTACAK